MKEIRYFEQKGEKNTEETLQLVSRRVQELGIRNVVVATNHGYTGLKAAKALKGLNANLIAVTICEGYKEEGWAMTQKERRNLESAGVTVLTSVHALGDNVDSAFTEKFGGKSFAEVSAQTLYLFSQGMKVCVEIVLMAADAGLIDVDEEVLAVAGTGSGADTAIVVKPSYPRRFLDLRILEIVCKPRYG